MKTIQLNGLKANYRLGRYKEGDVVYRKYGREWHIYLAYVGRGGTQSIMRATNDREFINENEELLEALKKAAKPFSQIDDKADNDRPLLGNISITYNERTLRITKYSIDYDGITSKTVAPTAAATKRAMYEALETFGAFLSKLI